jgi:hypothetical protein
MAFVFSKLKRVRFQDIPQFLSIVRNRLTLDFALQTYSDFFLIFLVRYGHVLIKIRFQSDLLQNLQENPFSLTKNNRLQASILGWGVGAKRYFALRDLILRRLKIVARDVSQNFDVHKLGT